MRVSEILDRGKSILHTDIRKFKDFYIEFQEKIKANNDLDSSIEFELQYLKYLMNVENNYSSAIVQANKLQTLSNITVYSLSKVHRTLGVAYYHTGNLTSSMESYLESVNLLNKIIDKNDEQIFELALTYHNISLLYRDEINTSSYDSEKRLEYIRLAENLFRSIQSNRGLSIIYNGLSNYYSNLKKYGLALRYQFKSIELKKLENDLNGLAINYGNISSIYLKFNKIDQAERYLLMSKDIKVNDANNYSKCLMYNQLGNLYKTKGDYKSSLMYYNSALELAAKHNLIYEHVIILSEMALLHDQNKNYELAYECLVNKIKTQENLQDKNKATALTELKYKYEYDKQLDEAKLLQKKNLEIQEYITKLKNTNYELKQFAQIASHDLKEPVRLIKIHVTKLEKCINVLDDKQEYLINFIKQTTDNLIHIVNELQKYTDIDHQHKIKEKIIVRDELGEVLTLVQKKLGDSSLELVYNNLPTAIEANKSHINQLFFQLIENAFLFNESSPKVVRVSYYPDDERHVFSIEDNGIGIDEVYYAKIFDIFERLHSDSTYRGTGIGLAIVKKILAEMDGLVEVKSQLGKGSHFIIKFNK